MSPPLPPRISNLAEAWRARVAPLQRWAWALGSVATTLIAAHVARRGTVPSRAGAAAAIAGVLLAWLAASVLARRAARRADREAVRV
ncbi:MAG TPA: hypothetical protein PLI95_30460, partial [Polyangiaceae bacterium]|nr:hypothetical protein [Polyangiaceae bacterium]